MLGRSGHGDAAYSEMSRMCFSVKYFMSNAPEGYMNETVAELGILWDFGYRLRLR